MSWELWSILMRISASLFIMRHHCTGSRRSRRILHSIGPDPELDGWDALWGGCVLYFCVRSRVHYSEHGPSVYVGETICFARRSCEHVTRILSPDGCTQQPFYGFVRKDCSDSVDVAGALCEWLFFPVRRANGDACVRKGAERILIRQIGVLNPPRCYKLKPLSGKSGSLGGRLFKTRRPMMRLRKRGGGKQALCFQEIVFPIVDTLCF